MARVNLFLAGPRRGSVALASASTLLALFGCAAATETSVETPATTEPSTVAGSLTDLDCLVTTDTDPWVADLRGGWESS